jgi:hypothetical protein
LSEPADSKSKVRIFKGVKTTSTTGDTVQKIRVGKKKKGCPGLACRERMEGIEGENIRTSVDGVGEKRVRKEEEERGL